ncbi:glycosyltransferase [Mycobacterium sp. 663a-19]|uniref:glycosyltransferase n=1 Tax=Mycobacterium sp. 663a-19 TaxID=2986148 RepID=UPI002D1EECED|nr:glycosyltransferase [Mycobacterium sp. 663a-19]MEB3981485.1 glycosyltransferase [Mycobacterium sp. 663a-19]
MKFALAAYGSRGDVEPCVTIGRELARRGHEVRMAVPPNMLDFAKSAGLAAVAYGPDTREQMNEAMDFIGGVGNLITALPQLVERVSRVWADKSAVLTSLADGVDLVVAGMNEQELATNVAEYHGIPLAALHFFPVGLLPSGWLSSGVTTEAADAQRRALGLPEVTVSATRADGGSLEIQAYDELCLPSVAAGWPEKGTRRPFVGALTLELPAAADDEVSAWIAAGTPPIYFGFGGTPVASPADTVAMIGEACTQLGERALICGGANDLTGIAHLDHVKVVDAVNHAAVFPVCRAVVHHGGAGTTAAGLRAGVPALILWVWLDQPFWAAAVEHLKVGSGHQFSTTTKESLVADLRSILVPECAARAREVASRMTTAAESITRAVDLLEDAARSGA